MGGTLPYIKQMHGVGFRAQQILGRARRALTCPTARPKMPACQQAGRATKGGVSPLIGRKISHYSVTEKLGAGGMGEVNRGRAEHLGRDSP